MTGATCSRANSRTLSRSASCSSVSRKSTMTLPFLYRSHAVTTAGEAAILAAGGGEAAGGVVAQGGRFDHRVDDEFTGQPQNVDVAFVLGTAFGDEGGALL